MVINFTVSMQLLAIRWTEDGYGFLNFLWLLQWKTWIKIPFRMTLFHLKVSWITMMLIHIFCFHFNLRHSKFNPMKFDHCYFGLFVLGTISVFCPSVAGVSRHFGMFPQVVFFRVHCELNFLIPYQELKEQFFLTKYQESKEQKLCRNINNTCYCH